MFRTSRTEFASRLWGVSEFPIFPPNCASPGLTRREQLCPSPGQAGDASSLVRDTCGGPAFHPGPSPGRDQVRVFWGALILSVLGREGEGAVPTVGLPWTNFDIHDAIQRMLTHLCVHYRDTFT